MPTAEQRLEAIPDVEIDEDGVFKYVLITVADSEDESVQKLVVRGNAEAEYHADVYEAFCRKTNGASGLHFDCTRVRNFVLSLCEPVSANNCACGSGCRLVRWQWDVEAVRLE